MLSYRVEINGNVSGNINWQITFGADTKLNGNETSQIYTAVDKFVEALRDIYSVTS